MSGARTFSPGRKPVHSRLLKSALSCKTQIPKGLPSLLTSVLALADGGAVLDSGHLLEFGDASATVFFACCALWRLRSGFAHSRTTQKWSSAEAARSALPDSCRPVGTSGRDGDA